MSVLVKINVSNPDDLLRTGQYGAGAVIRVESSATSGSGFVELGTVAITAATSYAYDDTPGTTGTYYRWRYSNALLTRLSDYSDEVQSGAVSAYATMADLREALPDTPPDSADNYLADLLVRASAIITERSGRDFFRHPGVTGTEARYFDTDGADRIIVPAGIVSLTTAEYTSSTGGALTALVAADWLYEPVTPQPGHPYWAVRLTGSGALGTWYRGRRLARLTGVFGWASVPTIIEAGTIALAREMYVMGLHHLSEPNPNPWAAVPEFLPRPTYEAIRFGSHLMGHLYT